MLLSLSPACGRARLIFIGLAAMAPGSLALGAAAETRIDPPRKS